MSDTLYSAAMASAKAADAKTQAGNAYFAKNSDRNPSEPQSLCLIPERAPSASTKVGDRAFDVADAGFAFLLSKPSWMSGGEMGVNSRGVAIGNEAVFARTKAKDDGVLGMHILRAALASSARAKDAVDFICRFTENNDQGGNGAYRGKLVYSNSYIVADPGEAFVVETAGRRWAWRQANVVDSISNAYTIEEDYKRLDTQTRKEISPVNERAACSDEADPGRKGVKESWKARFENRFYLRFTKGELRRAASLSALESARGKIDAMKMFGILRSHLDYDPAHPLRGHMESLCIHAGFGPANSATTASLVVEYRPDGAALVWFTGTSCPCVSLYKPILLAKGVFVPLWSGYDLAEDSVDSAAYWKRQKAKIDRGAGLLAGPGAAHAEFVARRDRLQKNLVDAAALACGSGGSESAARARADEIVAEWEKAF
jgi:dipeptidase